MPDTDTQTSRAPFAGTITRAAELAGKFDTPLWRLFGSGVRWLILAGLAIAVWAGKAYLADTIAKHPAVIEARAAAIEARGAAATAASKADGLGAGQTRIENTLAELSRGVAIVATKVDDSHAETRRDIMRLDTRLDAIQAAAAHRE